MEKVLNRKVCFIAATVLIVIKILFDIFFNYMVAANAISYLLILAACITGIRTNRNIAFTIAFSLLALFELRELYVFARLEAYTAFLKPILVYASYASVVFLSLKGFKNSKKTAVFLPLLFGFIYFLWLQINFDRESISFLMRYLIMGISYMLIWFGAPFFIAYGMNCETIRQQKLATPGFVQPMAYTPVAPRPPVPPVQRVSEEDERINQIRKYKALLDEGVITAQEFEAKKKQILGI